MGAYLLGDLIGAGDSGGRPVAQGVYYAVTYADGHHEMRRLVVVR